MLGEFLGRLHPVVVHLPIGFIIAGLFLLWVDRHKKEWRSIISFLFLWGGISAVVACITGYLQYLGEGYPYDTVKLHLWSGIATALFCFLVVYRLRDISISTLIGKIPISVTAILFLVLILLTGHMGGSITHGEDYLVEPLPTSVKKALGFDSHEPKELVLNQETLDETQLFENVVQPILNNNCTSCHNPRKRKGGLALHSEAAILKGGENGPVIATSKPEESDLVKRLLLPQDHEDHMPPEGKRQPNKAEIALLKEWIAAGHPFDQNIAQSGLDKSLFQSFFPKEVEYNFPNVPMVEANMDSIQSLKKIGLHVSPISKSTNYLRVSCINKPSFSDEDFEVFSPIAKQIAILDLGGTQVSDSVFEKLVNLPNLTVLTLDHTLITGNGIDKLEALQHLKHLNLSHTKFEPTYLSGLMKLQRLKKLYLFGTNVKLDSTSRQEMGKVQIDYGHYEVPPLPTDTIVF